MRAAAYGGRRPLYPRLLRLRYLRMGALNSFLLFEGMIALAALLAFAELVSWWAMAALPLTVAAMVKLNDLVTGEFAGVAGRAVAMGRGVVSPAPGPVPVVAPALMLVGPRRSGTPASSTNWRPEPPRAGSAPARGVAAVPTDRPARAVPGARRGTAGPPLAERVPEAAGESRSGRVATGVVYVGVVSSGAVFDLGGQDGQWGAAAASTSQRAGSRQPEAGRHSAYRWAGGRGSGGGRHARVDGTGLARFRIR